jgi:hypothetical protein
MNPYFVVRMLRHIRFLLERQNKYFKKNIKTVETVSAGHILTKHHRINPVEN